MSRSPFPSLRVEGGILPGDLFARIVDDDTLTGRESAAYNLAPHESVREAASRAFEYLTGAWTAFVREREKAAQQGRALGALTRDRWLLTLFRALDYGILPTTPAGGITAEDKQFPVSHHWDRSPIHLLGWGIDLDHRTKGVPGAAGAAPQSMVQELLNRADDYLWAILSNGVKLRLLRDSRALAGSAYVEFDLEMIFEERIFRDFVLLYRLVHASRLVVPSDETPQQCWLERWRTTAVAQGERARDRLEAGVKEAVAALGTGFLRHPHNAALRDQLASGALNREDYRRAILRLVYRLLFWFVTEDRDVLLAPDAPLAVTNRYRRFFSAERLRARALRGGGHHDDLWQAVRLVFTALGTEHGQPELALPGIGGLFERITRDDHDQPLTPSQPDALDAPLEGLRLTNDALHTAVRALAVVDSGGQRRPVDFQHLDSEELGSVYERILELHPDHDPHERTFALKAAAGSERKTTGSYYTPSSLVEALLDSTLDPLLDEAAASSGDPVEALLSITVCDPACGSGHFLVAAARRIARRVAQIRSGEDEPSPDLVRHAVREVVGRCIYGVDINDMAVELVKVSLWLESVEPGKPLPFLDANIRVGNSLLGTTPALLQGGIPKEAFKSVEGDDKRAAKAIQQDNDAYRDDQASLFDEGNFEFGTAGLGRETALIVTALPDRLVDTYVQRRRLRQLDKQRAQAKRVADAWCAAFVQEKTEKVFVSRTAINQATLGWIGGEPADETQRQTADRVAKLTQRYRFFHWHVEFPHIFDESEDRAAAGEQASRQSGFHCVIGNPPWDTLSPDRKEFFAAYNPEVRFAKKAAQDTLVESLLQIPSVANNWQAYRRDLYSIAHFFKDSGRYKLFAPGNLGKGDFNIYRIFVEAAMWATRPGGYATQILPGGFYNGANAMAIRKELYEHWQLKKVLGFINTTGDWFPGIHSDTSFSAYIARKGGSTNSVSVAFELRTPADLAQAHKGEAIQLTVDTIREQSPVALAIPEVTDVTGATIAARMYSHWPKFGDEMAGPPVRQYQREIDMGTDRGLFGEHEDGLPLYEGRMIDRYDHRAKAWRSGRGRAAVWEDLPFGPVKEVVPQWRVLRHNVPKKLGKRIDSYRIGFGKVTGPRNERSLKAALIPPGAICGDVVPTILFPKDYEWAYMPWLAIANSFSIDFLVRKKIALHITYSVLDSMPFPRLSVDHPLVRRLGPLALRLTCTSPEMTRYWNDMSRHGWCDPVPEGTTPPAIFDEASRATTFAMIDAIVARDVFDLTTDTLSAILDSFSVLRNHEEKIHQEYRSKRLVLEAYEAILEENHASEPHQIGVSPRPAHPAHHTKDGGVRR